MPATLYRYIVSLSIDGVPGRIKNGCVYLPRNSCGTVCDSH